MTTSKKATTSSKQMSRKTKQPEAVALQLNVDIWHRVRSQITLPFKKMAQRMQGLSMRRPHRSFRRTQRRDYTRSLKLPGYWAFTAHVRRTLWEQKKLFALLVAVYAALTIALVGIASQDVYSQLGDTLRSTTGELFKGNMGEVGKASLLLITGITGGATGQDITPAQQIYAVLLILFTWLTTVVLLRAILAGRKPKLRDGLYTAGSPVLPTFLVGLLLVMQLLPVALAVVGFGVAANTGLLDNGIESMLFWACATLLGALSLYWISSTLIALVVVTLPGMYPMQAIKTAGDLVIGRRVRILFRILWLILMVAIVWLVIMIPIIIFDTWLKGILPAIEWLPIVPIALLIMSTLTIVWVASYIYLLYRRVVDDDAAPA